MFEIRSLTVAVGDKKVVDRFSASFEKGKTYYLLGKNGSGKSSLSFAIAGHPRYSVTEGGIFLDGEDLVGLPPEERFARGVFLSLQNVPEINGVRLSEFLRSALNAKLKRENPESKPLSPFLAKRLFVKEAAALNIPESFLDRDLNVGFSGGEKRRIELLQIKILSPKIVILDEIDSGLDVDAFKLVAGTLSNLRAEDRTFLIVTHNFALTEHLPPDGVFVMEAGSVIDHGGKEVVDRIGKEGFSV